MGNVLRSVASGSCNLRKVVSLLALMLGVLLVAVPMFSQTATGRLSGTVKDQTGGSIAGAAVAVTDVARGLTRNLTTDAAGAYLAVQLIAGTYTVRATFTGFQAWERTNIVLGVGQEIAVDAVLLPGAQTQTVTVTEELPLVNTTSATLGGTLSNETINDLPLNGRNFTLLLELRPGVILTLGNDSGGTGAAATNGLRPEQSNEYIVEGLHGSSPFNAQPIFNALALRGDSATILPVDAIQEFNQQFNGKAEYGWRAGGTVNVGLKSGTNAFHGTGYTFFRRHPLDAQNYFSPKVNTNLNQFGGSVGGPIIQDKFFFFGGYEGQRVDVGDSVRSTTPFTDTSMLTGPGGFPGCLATRSCVGVAGTVNGFTQAPDARNHLILACQALAPANRSVRSLALASLNPANCSPLGTYPNSLTGDAWFVTHGGNDHGINGGVPITSYFSNLQSVVRALGSIGKLDYVLNDKNTFSGFAFVGNGDNIYSANKTQPIWRTSVVAKAKMFGGTWTFLPNAAWANAFRVGYVNNTQRYRGLDALEGTPAADLGLATGVTEIPEINGGYPQSLAINGFTALGSRNTELEGPYTSLEFNDQISYLLGDHSLRFGGVILTNNQNGASWGDTRGRFGFGQSASGSGGTNGLVAFMNGQLGYSDNIADGVSSNYCPGLVSGVSPTQTCNQPVIRTSQGNTGLQSAIRFYGDPTTHMRRTAYSAFLQDDWRISPRLTLNLGVRYELTTVIHDRDSILGTFDPKRGLIQEGVHVPRIFNPDHNNWGPRIGFAWDVQGNGKTVIRAGGSIIYELITFRTFTEIGNDIGVGANPTAFVTGCTVGPYGDRGGPFDFNLAAGDLDNCTGTIGGTRTPGAFTTPGGSRDVGSIEWTRGDGTIGALNWDGPGNTASGTIYPGSDAVKSCAPNLAFSDNPANPTLGRPGVACPVVTTNPNLRTPYVESWTLSIQRAITNNVVLEAAYVGNHGVKFMSHVDLNQARAGSAWTPSLIQDCIDSPSADACDGSEGSDLAFAARPFNTKFPYLATITSLGNAHTSNYNGLQLSVTARNFHGLSIVSGYTWSKSLDVASGNGSDVGTDSYNVGLDYGRANSDVRHRVTFAPTYNFPSVMGYGGLLDGWKINANLKYQTGRPYDAGGGDFAGNGRETRWDLSGDPAGFKTDYTGQAVAIFHPSDDLLGEENAQFGLAGAPAGATYAATDLASVTSACTAAAGGSAGKLASLAAFGCWTQGGGVITPPAPNTFGNMSRGALSGPGFFGLDMSIAKRHQITERLTAEFRGEFFNVLNHVGLAQPESGLGCEPGDCVFGQVFETPDTAATNPVLGTGGPRRIQLGLKLIF